MPGALHTAGRLGLELGRVGLDLATRAGGLPRKAADFDAVTMSRLIGRQVTRCAPAGGTSGTTDRSVLALEGVDVPATVFVKSAALDVSTRLFGGLARLGEVEVGFYRDLRPDLDLEAPQIHGSRFDRRTGRFVIVLEDLAARGATFVDTTTPLSVDQAAAALATLASLHGATTGRPGLPRWVNTNATDALLPLVSAGMGRLVGKVAAKDPSLVALGGERLLRSYAGWAGILDADAFCVLHGDPHPGNVYLIEGRVGLLDWQAVRRGNGLRDATYLMVLALETAARRAAERDLLAHYCAELAGAGGPRFSADQAWATYRQMVAYVYVSTTFTSGLGGLQGEEIADTGLRRTVVAVEDLETVAAIDAARADPR